MHKPVWIGTLFLLGWTALAGSGGCGGPEFQATETVSGVSAGAGAAGSEVPNADAGTGGTAGLGGSSAIQRPDAGSEEADSFTGTGGSSGAAGAVESGSSGGTAGQEVEAGASNDAAIEPEAAPEAATNCGVDLCHEQKTVPLSCNSCVVAVCAARPHCCVTEWDLECVLEARLHPDCGCSLLECSSAGTIKGGSASCMASEKCNPVSDTGCGSAAHCVLIPSNGDIVTNCQTTGYSEPCKSCDNQYLACTQGHSCLGGRCLRLCCDAEDCPAGSFCSKDILPSDVASGVCTLSTG